MTLHSRALLQLRDPARTNEWKGAWSDGAPEWRSHPAVQSALEQKGDEASAGGPGSRRDGSFWMTWEVSRGRSLMSDH